MIRVYLADARPQQRSVLGLLLLGLRMELAGEAADWPTTRAQAPLTRPDLLLVDWSLLPAQPSAALSDLRLGCPGIIRVLLLGRMDNRHQAALSAGADGFISRAERPERVAEHLRVAADSIRSQERQSKLRLYNMYPGT